MTEERIKILQSMPIFGGVRDDILDLILEDAVEISLEKGDYLFVEDEPGDAMYVLEQGKVAILKLCDEIQYRLN
ncbi:MAG: cyclic nucleotide-binding domain-containing protein, partial [Chromatiaceae bacterium]|nr:cyclic nucleotide-binding domain-containing protein [Chromatiaceae bacterium]